MKKVIFVAMLSPFFWGDWLDELKVSILKFSRTPVGVTFRNDADTADSVLVSSGEIAHYPRLKEADIIKVEAGALLYAPELKQLPEMLIIKPGSAIHYEGHYVGSDLKPKAYLITYQNIAILVSLLLLIFGVVVFGKSYRPYRYHYD